MVNVGIIGLGLMGKTHLAEYANRHDARVVALSDTCPRRLNGTSSVKGNIAGQAQDGFDYASARHYQHAMDLIHDPDIDLVDLCLPTPLHVTYATAILRSGKHLLIEKPLGRNAVDVAALVTLAESAPGYSMCAKCMRFWPEWVWLKQAITQKTYGNVLGAQFRRVSHHPGGAFYRDGNQSGGAVLDLHIHDTDFIQYCFGLPEAVNTVGYSAVTGELDHLVTQYYYNDIPLVVAEAGWTMSGQFGFRMQYTVNFEYATASFDVDQPHTLVLWEPHKPKRTINTPNGLGYKHEIGYMLNCLNENRRPTISTFQDAARSLDIIEAEVRSATTRRPEAVVSAYTNAQ